MQRRATCSTDLKQFVSIFTNGYKGELNISNGRNNLNVL
jgi:hypothetical protein